MSSALRDRVAARLADFPRQAIDDVGLRRAAVSVVLTEEAGGPAFLLTRRSSNLRRHSGQFALPGGRVDAGESVAGAALRELAEELGLALGPEAVLGSLDDYATRSGFVITPLVVWAGKSPELAPEPAEVARVFRVPLAELRAPDVLVLDHFPDRPQPVLSLRLVDNRVFAPTGAILYQLREVALEGRLTRVADYDQPRFAWS